MKSGIFVLLGSVLFVGASIPLIAIFWPRMWRGEAPYSHIDHVPSNWLWGASGWHAAIRTWLLASAGAPILGAAGLAMSFGNDLWLAILFSSWVIWFVLLLSVVLFNRPTFPVPPYLRSRPGMIRELLNRTPKS